MQVSAHAKQRMSERLTNYSSLEKPVKVFETALRYGKKISDFYGDFHDYLEQILTKQRGTDVRVYADNVFVYESRKKILITVWNIPQEYEPYKNYLTCNKPMVDQQESKARKEQAKLLKQILKEGYSYNNFTNPVNSYLQNLCDSEIDVRIFEDKIYLFNKDEETIIDKLDIPNYCQPYQNFFNEGGDYMMNLDELVKTRPMGQRKKGHKDSIFDAYDSKLKALGYRECRRCAEPKPLSDFRPRPESKDGYYSYCSDCMKELYIERKQAKLGKTVKEPKKIKHVEVHREAPKSNESFEVSAITQVFGFSQYLRDANISDIEFISFIKSYNKDILNALEVYNHLSDKSKELYLIMQEGK